MKWLKSKFRSWLDVDYLETQLNNGVENLEVKYSNLIDEHLKLLDEYQQLNERAEELRVAYNQVNNNYTEIQYLNRSILRKNDAIVSQFNLSADIYERFGESWAVISVAGKPEYVSFINLSNQDMRSIHSFLKQFEGTNRTVDSPVRFLDLKE